MAIQHQHQSSHDQRSGLPDLWPGPEPLKLLSGSAHPQLTQAIGQYIKVDPSPMVRKRFADGESYVRILESVRGCDAYIVQPTCCPVNDHLMELLLLADACRRASARQITAVVPYYGYGRSDRKQTGREAIIAKLVANLLTQAGVDRVVTLDLHQGQIQAFFDVPCDHLLAEEVIADHLLVHLADEDWVVVSPDVGGVPRARAFARRLKNAPLAIIDRRGEEGSSRQQVIGEVKGLRAILVDDMIDTAETAHEGAQILMTAGVREVIICATHAVFTDPAVQRLRDSRFAQVIVTNTIPIPEEKQFPQLKVLSVAQLLGEAILRIHRSESVSSMFT